MDVHPEDVSFDHNPHGKSEQIPFDNISDYSKIKTTTTAGGIADTSFITPTSTYGIPPGAHYGGPTDNYGRPLDNLYEKSTLDGNAFDTKAEVHSTDGNAFDTEADVHSTDERDIDHSLPDTPLITPSTEPGGNIGNLRDELNAAAAAEAEAKAKLEAAKIALVNEFYQSIAKEYKSLNLPEKIPYDQFYVSENGKTVYWTPEEGKVIPLRKQRGGGFSSLRSLAGDYGKNGTDVIRTSMGLENYKWNTRKTGELSPNGKEKIEQANNELPAKNEEITPDAAGQAIKSAEISTNK
ncbi:hypothetical protein RRG08_008404 [Elysia crispata]|uniref:Uncharacterized protein n=1 Tax=Elysia crispata TaxID=231223 RepID=A0AAE1DM37_9GAST|nr:hypothetical protein RRG08_008404 [Elysia crispata]